MATDHVVVHWRKRARNSLKIARFANYIGSPADALVHCHLALERALKAAIMQKTGKSHPEVHDLLALAGLLSPQWSAEERSLFDTLTDLASTARHDDPAWAERHATRTEALYWIARTEQLVSRLLE